VLTGVALIDQVRGENPTAFSWRPPPYEYEHDKEPIDILFGSDELRTTVNVGGDVSALISSWSADQEAFQRLRQPFLMY